MVRGTTMKVLEQKHRSRIPAEFALGEVISKIFFHFLGRVLLRSFDAVGFADSCFFVWKFPSPS